MAFMASEIPTHRTLPARARSARPPHKAIAMPRAANTSAPASGIPACIAATTSPAVVLTSRTRTYCAWKLTAAAVAARRPSAAIATRSHVAARSRSPGCRSRLRQRRRGGAVTALWPFLPAVAATTSRPSSSGGPSTPCLTPVQRRADNAACNLFDEMRQLTASIQPPRIGPGTAAHHSGQLPAIFSPRPIPSGT